VDLTRRCRSTGQCLDDRHLGDCTRRTGGREERRDDRKHHRRGDHGPREREHSDDVVRALFEARPVGEPDDEPEDEAKTALSLLGHRVLVLDAERERLNLLLGELVYKTAPQLLEIHGVGVDTAATLLVTAGDNPGRIRSEAAWAHLCGVAPIQASSGKVTRVRLDRGGDRQANSALWGL